MSIFKNFTIYNKGLRYKLMLAFSLMSIIPLLASMYIISLYTFPHLETLGHITVVVIMSLVISILGLILAKSIVDPVINMALEAKIIASGEYDRKIVVSSDDEIGNLGNSINAMTQKIKSNLDELKGYGNRMKEINVEIHKKVLGLSSLLQIGDIIAAGSVQLDALLELVVEKASTVFDTGFGILYMPKEEGGDLFPKIRYNIDQEKLGDLIIKRVEDSFLEKALENRSLVVIDKSKKWSKDMEEFKSAYNVKNALIVPIHSTKRNWGLLLIGNRLEDFKYKTDDLELISVFAKQISIAIESDILSKRTEELAIKDDLTDLYNKNFILGRLEEEIKRAVFYQRPCSFIVLNIDNFKGFRETHSEMEVEEALKKMARLIRDSMIPVGKAARIGVDEFAVLLPEKNKKEAAHIAEEIRKKIESTNLLREGKAIMTVSGGVSENPIDGATGDELLRKAIEAVKGAKSAGKNKVIA